MQSLKFLALASVMTVAACSSPEGFSSGVTRSDTVPFEGRMESTKVGCSETESCSAHLNALDGGSRANAIVWMPRGCYHVQTSIIAGPDGKTFARRPGYVRPAMIELEREDLVILGNGGIMVSTFDGCPADASGSQERAEKISFPADQVNEINGRLIDRIDYAG